MSYHLNPNNLPTEDYARHPAQCRLRHGELMDKEDVDAIAYALAESSDGIDYDEGFRFKYEGSSRAA